MMLTGSEECDGDLSERFRRDHPEQDAQVDWYWIDGSWVAAENIALGLSSIGQVWKLEPDPNHPQDTHAIEHIRHGLLQLHNGEN
jgi:hypothetical protein